MRPGRDRQERTGAKRSPFFPLVAAGAVVAAAVFAVSTCSSDGDDGPGGVSQPSPAPSTAALGATATPAPAPADEAVDAAAGFLSALAKGRYGDMWEMLAPASQQAWGGGDPSTGRLAAFLERKFGGRKLGFKAGDPVSIAAWRDADTGTVYQDVVSVPFAVRADGKDEPEFSLAPVVLAREGGAWRVAGLGPAARRGPAFTPVPRAQGTMNVPILVYHHVKPQWPDDFEGRTITVIASDFESELAYLRDSGYETVSLAELANALLYGLALPEKPVVLTFDDGYDDMYAHAFPLLQKYGLTGSFGLVTGYLGNSGYLTWDQAREMSDAGNEMVSHSVGHTDLGAATPEQAAAEVRDSRAALEKNLGRPMQALIYPYGEPFAHGSVEAQERVTGVLREEGYGVGVTNPLPNELPGVIQDASLPYQLKRVMVSGGMGLGRFVARLEGHEVE